MKTVYAKNEIIPARPGYFAIDVQFSKENDDFNIVRNAVIAWHIWLYGDNADDTAFEVFPVCHEQQSDFGFNAVQHPDGSVVIRGDRSWRTLDEYAADLKQRLHNRDTAFQTRAEELFCKDPQFMKRHDEAGKRYIEDLRRKQAR
jgi:hypothetical protein